MKIIGLTGNTGSGKSTTAKIAAERGGCIIDADCIAHNIIEKGKKAYNEIKEYFGEKVIGENGEIDRKRLGGIVFNDRNELERLNVITHKYIIEEIKKEIENNKKMGEKHIIIDAPLLIETGLDKYCDEVWVTVAEEEIRIDRIMKRDKITRENALARINNQKSSDELKEYADFIIENNGNNFDDIISIISERLK